MPTYTAQHTFMIETSGSSLRWRLTVGPTREKNPGRGTCESSASIQVILELIDTAADRAQLDFGF